MVAEAIAGLGAIKTAFDLAKGLKDMNDAAVRNAAVIELQERILTAQQAQAALLARIGQLEKEVAEFEAWDAEKERYQLTDFGGNTFAYLMKEPEGSGEPPHRLCVRCYEERHKGILQFVEQTYHHQDQYRCSRCSTVYEFGVGRTPPLPQVRTRAP